MVQPAVTVAHIEKKDVIKIKKYFNHMTYFDFGHHDVFQKSLS